MCILYLVDVSFWDVDMGIENGGFGRNRRTWTMWSRSLGEILIVGHSYRCIC